MSKTRTFAPYHGSRFVVQSGQGKGKYQTRFGPFASLRQAIRYYNAINIGYEFKKRLIETLNGARVRTLARTGAGLTDLTCTAYPDNQLLNSLIRHFSFKDLNMRTRKPQPKLTRAILNRLVREVTKKGLTIDELRDTFDAEKWPNMIGLPKGQRLEIAHAWIAVSDSLWRLDTALETADEWCASDAPDRQIKRDRKRK